jgi:hypothetical protein
MTLFTLIGCDNLPTEPISNGNENYSITTGQSNNDEVLNYDALPVSNDFIVRKPKSEYPLDSVLVCMNLTPEQMVELQPIVNSYHYIKNDIPEGRERELKSFKYTEWYKYYMDSLNPQPTDKDYSTKMKKMNWAFKEYSKMINKKFDDSLKNYRRYTVIRISYNRKANLTYDQRNMLDKWNVNPFLTCEFLKP